MKADNPPSERRYPKSVAKILVVKPAKDGPADKVEVSTGGRDKKKKKVSKGLRGVDRELRALVDAAQTYFDSYDKRHKDSADRKKDGALKDYLKNSRRARKEAGKALRKRSKLFKKLRPPRMLRKLGRFKF